MKRFTANSSGKCAKAHSELCEKYPKCDLCPHMNNAFRRLAYYEDMEEQGRLVVLPCKVGETVWMLFSHCFQCEFADDTDSCGDMPFCGTKVAKEVGFKLSRLDSFGKTVFLTREEAEQALKGGAEA